VDRAHLRGIVVADTGARRGEDAGPTIVLDADLLRPLAEYEQAAGGMW
jgi:hypothetical protein